jgi:NAD(P)-dependent dehydrogenase (short-subunit alcohol dehydrogenase family)
MAPTVVITGATSGIGQAAARRLAAEGARVVLGARSPDKGAATLEAIESETPGAKVSFSLVDTASKASVRAFTERLSKELDRIDVLINNAGTYALEPTLGPDGYELVFATNVLGYYGVATGLAEKLKASAPARLINVASGFARNLDLDDLDFSRRGYDGAKAYSASKQADRLLTWALARRFEGTGVTVNAMTPGMVWSGLYRETRGASRFILEHIVTRFFGKTPEEGADTMVWLATSDEVEGISGRFFQHRKEKPRTFADEAQEEKLYALLDEMWRA